MSKDLEKRKTAICIKMLQYLNTGRVYKISELAAECETNPRNIIEYRKELESIGYSIIQIPGRYGGYQLDSSSILPSIKLSIGERNTLLESYKILMSNPGYIDKKSLLDTYSKLFSTLLIEDKGKELVSINKVNVYNRIREISEWHRLIEKAIKEKKAILMDYEFLKEPRHVTKVHPYQLFIYDNEWRFIGWSCDTNDIFYYKLSRIKNIEFTNQRFSVWCFYRFEDYVKDGVFTQNGKMMRVELIASGIRAKLFKEKDFGVNQVCEDLPDGTTKVSLDLQENPSTYNFILGCGELVEVIAPKELRDKIKEMSKNIYAKYKK